MQNNLENPESQDDDGMEGDVPITGAEAVRDVFTHKDFLAALERVTDKFFAVKGNVLQKNARLFLWAVILRYVLSAAVLGGVIYLLAIRVLTEVSAVPLLTAIVASLFVPPKRE